MAEEETDEHLSHDALRRMVRVVEPTWELEAASLVEKGRSAIHRVHLATPNGARECFLKATPIPDDPFGIGTEARLTETVRRRTAIPAPTVIGAVDAHETLRAPYFLMEAMSGASVTRKDRPRIPAANVRALARQTGRYIGELHDIPIPNVERFGFGLSHRADSPLTGGRPSADPTAFEFPDGHATWTAQLAEWQETHLDGLADTDRFDDLVSPIDDRITELLEEFPTSFTPALARYDHGLWNLLVDPDCRRSTAVLDWGALVVAPPAFDLAQVEYYLAGGIRLGLDPVPDHRDEIRDGLVQGYTDVRSMPSGYEPQRRWYQLDTIVLHLLSLDSAEETPQSVPESRTDEAAAGLRRLIGTLL